MWSSNVLFSSSIVASIVHLVQAQDAGTVTIFDNTDLAGIRPCARSCMGSVRGYIECPTSPLLDSCFCRTDLIPAATSGLANCVDVFCDSGEAVDRSAMVSIYVGYCSSYNGNQPAPTSASPTTDEGENEPAEATTLETITRTERATITRFTGTITTDVASAVTEVVLSTFTTVLDGQTLEQFAAEYQASQSGGGLERGYQVAIGVGVVAIVIIILLLFMNKIRRRWFGYKGPYAEPPLPPMGGIQGTGQENLGQPNYYK